MYFHFKQVGHVRASCPKWAQGLTTIANDSTHDLESTPSNDACEDNYAEVDIYENYSALQTQGQVIFRERV